MRPELITDEYGFITDYLSEFFREMRKRTFSDALDKYFKLGNNLNQRDVIAVRKTVSGLIKLIYPDGEYSKEDLVEILGREYVGLGIVADKSFTLVAKPDTTTSAKDTEQTV